MKDLFDVQQLSQFEFGAIIITILIAGLVFGCLLAYWLLKRKNSPDAQAAVAMKQEFEEYKDKVDDHFNKTSEMFMDVTTQYKKLYDHMAVGAIALSKADTINMPRLEMQDSQEDDVQDATDNTPEQPSSDSADETTSQEPDNATEPEEITPHASDKNDAPDATTEEDSAKTI